jgi:hypothetical protein
LDVFFRAVIVSVYDIIARGIVTRCRPRECRAGTFGNTSELIDRSRPVIKAESKHRRSWPGW